MTALRSNLGSSISCNVAKVTSCKTADMVNDMTSITMDTGTGWKIPLHMSAEKGHDKCVRAMLDSGVDVDAVNSTGRTALHLAAKNGHVDVMKTLLNRMPTSTPPMNLADRHSMMRLIMTARLLCDS